MNSSFTHRTTKSPDLTNGSLSTSSSHITNGVDTVSENNRTPLLCDHCGEPCNNGISLEHQSGIKHFCCDGCKFVFEMLDSNGLCKYYELDERVTNTLKQPLRNSTNEKFAYLDHESISEQLTSSLRGSVRLARFFLPTIHCTSCIWLLEKLHKLDEGILQSQVHFTKKTIRIVFDCERTSLRKIVELLAFIGYEPELKLDSLSQKSVQSSVSPQTKIYLRLGLAGFAFANIMIFSFPEYLAFESGIDSTFTTFFRYVNFLLSIPVLLYSASDYFRSAWLSLRERELNLDVPIALGLTSLFVRSSFDIFSSSGSGYFDSFSGLVFFLLIGKLLQQKTFDAIAFNRNYKSYFPISATRKLTDGREESVPISTLRQADCIMVREQEIVPADSILLSESALADYSFVTGESLPVEVVCGQSVSAGARIIGGAAELQIAKITAESQLVEMWNNPVFSKKKETVLPKIASIFATYFTIIVLVVTTATIVYWWGSWNMLITAATAVLIVACPCALTLASPFALGWAMSAMGARGFYIKNPGVILDLTTLTTAVFDKTGTLTRAGETKVEFFPFENVASDLHSEKTSIEAITNEILCPTILSIVYSGLKQSTHPLSKAIASFALMKLGGHGSIATMVIEHFCEISGSGITFSSAGHKFRIGSANFLQVSSPRRSVSGSSVFIEMNGKLLGEFVVQHVLRANVGSMLLKLQNKLRLYLLSGDNRAANAEFSAYFGGTEALYFGATPEEKLAFVRKLTDKGEKVAMVGDGLNDAGALQASTVGISVSEQAGSFSPACDAVIGAQTVEYLGQYLEFAQTTRRIIIGAFWISVVYNIIGLAFAVSGSLSPLVAAIFMPLSSWSIVGFVTAAVKIRASRMLPPITQ